MTKEELFTQLEKYDAWEAFISNYNDSLTAAGLSCSLDEYIEEDETLNDVLRMAFQWRYTPEGFDFWKNICNESEGIWKTYDIF